FSEEAAKKRVARALEKLRRLLGRHGPEISVAALIAGLAYETASAASLTANVSQITAAALAPAAGTSALAAEVLHAGQLAKLKLAAAIGAGAVVTTLLLWPVISSSQKEAAAASTPAESIPPASANTGVANNNSATNPHSAASAVGDVSGTHPLQITVLDAITGEPIPGAKV